VRRTASVIREETLAGLQSSDAWLASMKAELAAIMGPLSPMPTAASASREPVGSASGTGGASSTTAAGAAGGSGGGATGGATGGAGGGHRHTLPGQRHRGEVAMSGRGALEPRPGEVGPVPTPGRAAPVARGSGERGSPPSGAAQRIAEHARASGSGARGSSLDAARSQVLMEELGRREGELVDLRSKQFRFASDLEGARAKWEEALRGKDERLRQAENAAAMLRRELDARSREYAELKASAAASEAKHQREGAAAAAAAADAAAAGGRGGKAAAASDRGQEFWPSEARKRIAELEGAVRERGEKVKRGEARAEIVRKELQRSAEEALELRKSYAAASKDAYRLQTLYDDSKVRVAELERQLGAARSVADGARALGLDRETVAATSEAHAEETRRLRDEVRGAQQEAEGLRGELKEAREGWAKEVAGLREELAARPASREAVLAEGSAAVAQTVEALRKAKGQLEERGGVERDLRARLERAQEEAADLRARLDLATGPEERKRDSHVALERSMRTKGTQASVASPAALENLAAQKELELAREKVVRLQQGHDAALADRAKMEADLDMVLERVASLDAKRKMDGAQLRELEQGSEELYEENEALRAKVKQLEAVVEELEAAPRAAAAAGEARGGRTPAVGTTPVGTGKRHLQELEEAKGNLLLAREQLKVREVENRKLKAGCARLTDEVRSLAEGLREHARGGEIDMALFMPATPTTPRGGSGSPNWAGVEEAPEALRSPLMDLSNTSGAPGTRGKAGGGGGGGGLDELQREVGNLRSVMMDSFASGIGENCAIQ